MEETGIICIVGIVLFVLIFAITFIVVYIKNKKRIGEFREYMVRHYPDVSPTQLMHTADQFSNKNTPNDIAILAVDEQRKIYILQMSGKSVLCKVYEYADLVDFNSEHHILAGAQKNTHIYEEGLFVQFNDGLIYRFFSHYPSNAYGDDDGAKIIKNQLAPWKHQLDLIIEGNKQAGILPTG